MIGKILLILVVCGGTGLLYLHNYGYLPTVISNLQTACEPMISFAKQNAVYLGAAFTGITTIGALIARKISSLTQTKNAVVEQNEVLQSTLANTSLSQNTIQEKLNAATQKLEVYEGQFGGDVVTKIQGLSTQLQDAQNTITTQKDELNISIQRARSLEAERNYLQDQLKAAQNQIDVLEGRVKPPIE